MLAPSLFQPALPAPLSAGLEEVAPVAAGDWAAAFGFALARMTQGEDRRPIVLAASRAWLGEWGWPQPAGLAAAPGRRWLLVAAEREEQGLWALEEALKSGAVAGGLAGAAKVALVASRRLDFAARTGRAAAVLLRPPGADDLSAAHRRWRVEARPSRPSSLDLKAPGAARLRAELVRRRDGPPGAWDLELDHETHRLRLVAGLADHGLVADGWTVAAA